VDISLVDVTRENYEAVCRLTVAEDQEDLLSPNIWSLVEASFENDLATRAICAGDTIVGFFMWHRQAKHIVSIWRFMIDEKFQRKGIGKAALKLAIAEIKRIKEVREIVICYHPENAAKALYFDLGFVETGLDDQGIDMLAVLKI